MERRNILCWLRQAKTDCAVLIRELECSACYWVSWLPALNFFTQFTPSITLLVKANSARKTPWQLDVGVLCDCPTTSIKKTRKWIFVGDAMLHADKLPSPTWPISLGIVQEFDPFLRGLNKSSNVNSMQIITFSCLITFQIVVKNSSSTF